MSKRSRTSRKDRQRMATQKVPTTNGQTKRTDNECHTKRTDNEWPHKKDRQRMEIRHEMYVQMMCENYVIKKEEKQ
jgi:hypothetical protein